MDSQGNVSFNSMKSGHHMMVMWLIPAGCGESALLEPVLLVLSCCIYFPTLTLLIAPHLFVLRTTYLLESSDRRRSGHQLIPASSLAVEPTFQSVCAGLGRAYAGLFEAFTASLITFMKQTFRREILRASKFAILLLEAMRKLLATSICR